jgi:hypothetical protein
MKNVLIAKGTESPITNNFLSILGKDKYNKIIIMGKYANERKNKFVSNIEHNIKMGRLTCCFNTQIGIVSRVMMTSKDKPAKF